MVQISNFVTFHSALFFHFPSSTTGNFGPGRSDQEVNEESVTTPPERHEANESDEEDDVPLSQLHAAAKKKKTIEEGK